MTISTYTSWPLCNMVSTADIIFSLAKIRNYHRNNVGRSCRSTRTSVGGPNFLLELRRGYLSPPLIENLVRFLEVTLYIGQELSYLPKGIRAGSL